MKLEGLLKAFKDELLINSRPNKWLFILLLGMPIVYTILFGYTYQANVLNNIPIVVCDVEQTKISRSLINYYETSDKFTVVEQVRSLEELEEAIKEDRAKVGVYIPKIVSKTIKYGRTPEIGIYVNATNVVYGNAALSSFEEINTNVNVGGAQKVLERVNYYPDEAMEAAYPAQIKVRILNNPVNGYTEFMLLGLTCNGIQISLYLYASALLWKRRKLSEYGTINYLLGRQAAICLISMTSFIISIFIAHYNFYVPLKGEPLQFFILMLSFVLMFSSLATLFSLVFPDGVHAIQSTLLFIMPGLLYSGLSWPGQACNFGGLLLAHIFPITYIGMPLRYLSLAGEVPALYKNVGIMLASFATMTAINYFLLKRRKEAADGKVCALD